MTQLVGEVIQIIGPVIDISFERAGNEMPNIHDALEIRKDDGQVIVVECQQHIGENSIRAIAMDSTDGLRRGMKATCTGWRYPHAHWRTDPGPVAECNR